MIKHRQLLRNDPDNSVFGDCQRTAMACILDLPTVEEAPHFIGEWYRLEKLKESGVEVEFYVWQDEQERWLNSLGYTTVDIVYNGDEPLEGLFSFMNARNPEVFYLLVGQSRRGTNHVVVCHGGGFYWDPHPDRDFLVGPMDNGFYEVTFVLPLIMKEELK